MIQIKSRLGIVLKELEFDLRGADLRGADLRDADLRDANLCGADLRDANLRDANLNYADLCGADLRDADLYGADLCSANLRGANLRDANLRDANLYGADLDYANLYGADLCSANLRGANLRGANLRDAKNISKLIEAQLNILPEGDIIGYKRCRQRVIVKLLIPSTARRSCATGRKCRAEYAKVLEIYGAEIGYSINDIDFTYRVGETVRPDSWDDNRWSECSNGIHFFITREEAEDYC